MQFNHHLLRRVYYLIIFHYKLRIQVTVIEVYPEKKFRRLAHPMTQS